MSGELEMGRIAWEHWKAQRRKPEQRERENPEVPATVGLIMDGNRRWAEANGLPIIEGHRAGIQPIETVVNSALEVPGIDALTFWAFSTDNWLRPREEVGGLLTVFEELFDHPMIERMIDNGVSMQAVGRWNAFPKGIKQRVAALQDRSARGDALQVNFALNYGGRPEIVDAVNAIPVWRRVLPITERALDARMYTPNHHPDLIIRTSGEERLSGFQMWGSEHSELHFSDQFWPDFGAEDFSKALESFAGRNRRKGK